MSADAEQAQETTPVVDYETAMENGTESAVVRMPKPDLKTGRFGLLGKYYRIHKTHKRRRKLARKGYVRWFLVDETFPEPKFVKPELDGSGLPEVRQDGVPYTFPRAAMLPDERNGMYTVVHKRGDSEPINLQDPAKEAIPADLVDDWIQLQLHRDPPSWWDNIDLDPQTIMAVAIGLTILIAVLLPVFGGG
jgi:hypothetical protein